MSSKEAPRNARNGETFRLKWYMEEEETGNYVLTDCLVMDMNISNYNLFDAKKVLDQT